MNLRKYFSTLIICTIILNNSSYPCSSSFANQFLAPATIIDQSADVLALMRKLKLAQDASQSKVHFVSLFEPLSNVNIIPMGFMALMASMKTKKLDNYSFSAVGYMTLLHEKVTIDERYTQTVEHIKKNNINIVGVSANVNDNFLYAKLIQRLKKDLPDLIIVAGGPACTIQPQIIMDELKPDILLRGEAEETFIELIAAIGNKRIDEIDAEILDKFKKINGLFYRSRTGQFEIKDRLMITERITDLDQYDYPIEEIAQYNYMDNLSRITVKGRPIPPERIVEAFKEHAICIVTERGCPKNCPFCSRTHGKRVYAMRPEKMLELVKKLLEETPYKVIGFHDDDFLINGRYGDGSTFKGRDRAIEFCRLYEESGLLKQYGKLDQCQVSVSSLYHDGKVDYEAIEAFSKTFNDVYIGTDGFCDEELERLKKGYSWDKVPPVVEAFERFGLPNIHYVLLVNIDTSTENLAESLINLITLHNMNEKCEILLGSSNGNCIQPYEGNEYMEDLKRRELLDRLIWFTYEDNISMLHSVLPLDPIVQDVIYGELIYQQDSKTYVKRKEFTIRMSDPISLTQRLIERIRQERTVKKLDETRLAYLEKIATLLKKFLSGATPVSSAPQQMKKIITQLSKLQSQSL